MSHTTRGSEEDVKIGKVNLPGEWLWRILCTGLLIVNLWAKTNYVSLADYKTDRDAAMSSQKQSDDHLNKLENLISKIQEENKVNDRQDETLKDHEARLRVLETKTH
jgi:hypothetical protein